MVLDQKITNSVSGFNCIPLEINVWGKVWPELKVLNYRRTNVGG